MNQLFKNYILKERVNSFRELTKTLVKMAGTDEVVPEEDESVPWGPSILGSISNSFVWDVSAFRDLLSVYYQ